jgi:hypothetical protein
LRVRRGFLGPRLLSSRIRLAERACHGVGSWKGRAWGAVLGHTERPRAIYFNDKAR